MTTTDGSASRSASGDASAAGLASAGPKRAGRLFAVPWTPCRELPTGCAAACAGPHRASGLATIATLACATGSSAHSRLLSETQPLTAKELLRRHGQSLGGEDFLCGVHHRGDRGTRLVCCKSISLGNKL